MKKLLLLLLTLATGLPVWAQQNTQIIKGSVTDAQSGYPLVGATVILLEADPVIASPTDGEGNFRLAGVPLGRQTLQVRYLGYKAQIVPNLVVTAGKEVMVQVALEEQVLQGQEVVITGEREKGVARNEFATVSARTFNPEQTARFAGSRNDPARMAANYAGVSGANDSRNDIIIRGNSPAGLLWRLDGINIPNPNHYGALGSTGGPVSMLNYNMLDQSDFLTAAFPAQYGNALAGVFDLQLRTGNNEKREYLGQVGFNGFEIGAEGPLDSESKASYLANYRYSTLGVFKALGLDFGTGSAIPQYQDATFKVVLPTQKTGTFSVFGLGGVSRINLLGSEEDTTALNLYGSENQDWYLSYQTGVMGASHQYYFNPTTYSRISLAASGTRQTFYGDSLSTETRVPVPLEEADYRQNKYSLNLLVHKKFSARNTLTTGAILDLYTFDLQSYRIVTGSTRAFRNSDGQSLLTQAYTQWLHRFSDNLSLNAGLTGQHFGYSNSLAVEPRLGLKYFLNARQSLSLGYGHHSQMQPLQSYFTRTTFPDGRTALTNQHLDFVQSKHLAFSYDYSFSPDLRLKVETYYQRLSDAAVESRPSSFSMLNAGADFSIPDTDSLLNAGRGRNYGVELTLEKFYSDGYYFLATGSLFDSKYQGSDGMWRNTAFNGHYVVNALAGKEIKVGRGQRNSLNLDWKMTVAGGRYVTPIDLERSRLAGQAVYREQQAFSRQLDDYFRTDLKIAYRRNQGKTTHEFSLDLQNLTNRKNVFTPRYNPRTNVLGTEYQMGFFPSRSTGCCFRMINAGLRGARIVSHTPGDNHLQRPCPTISGSFLAKNGNPLRIDLQTCYRRPFP